jgi:hypothetical protein
MEIRNNFNKGIDTGIAKLNKQKEDFSPQVGKDEVHVGEPVRSSALCLRFAIDENNNKKIEPEEIKNLSQLSAKDKDGNGKLNDKELKGIFFEYCKDNWMDGSKVNNQTLMDVGNVPIADSSVELKEIDLKTNQADMDISISLRMPDYSSLFPGLKNFPGC